MFSRKMAKGEEQPLLCADAGSIQAEAGMAPGDAAAVTAGPPKKAVHTAHNAVG